MSALIEKYNSIVKNVKKINGQISNCQKRIKEIQDVHDNEVPSRIENLNSQIEKIDEYLLKIRGFQELAKKNIESQNVLTIEAPPGYRVNLNRLRNWAMMIDPMSSNDPYAQRVFVVAKCDEFFLEKKKAEFILKIENLNKDINSENNEEIEELEKEIEALSKQLENVFYSEDIGTFAKEVISENYRFWYEAPPETFLNKSNYSSVISPGAYAASFDFGEEQREKLKGQFGRFIDNDGIKILLPVEITTKKENVLTITCSPARSRELDRGIQNLILNIIDKNPAGTQKVLVIDSARFNSSSISGIKCMQGTFALEQIPRNPDQVTTTLESLISSFADTDEIIELCDSVREYNNGVEEKNRLPYTTVVLYGWPNSYEKRDKELIHRMMTNYERYGVSFITISYRNEEKDSNFDKDDMPEYAKYNSIHISMLPKKTTIQFPDAEPQRFTWYTFSGELPQEYAETLTNSFYGKKLIGNEYTDRYSLTDIPNYTREYKKIELPFGIDGKDEAHSVSFENENFATYLVGASRSGKSTLLHTLIAGLIRNYHPDNLELWLADFKQLEFKRYINHLPPHVKYILLDESTELVFDLIDKLTNEMLERQKLFARLSVQRIDQIDTTVLEKPLPVIFVILDEFSIMSQSIAESPSYKLKLQNILAKGAALGIKFLFSSQTFTTGVAGLTATARAQIQQRIAMKGSKEEISETLELSSNLKTEQVRNWMDALPPHYALVKFRLGADTLPLVKRYLVMYFKDYEPRDEMIEYIKSSMTEVEDYNPTDNATYVSKQPVLVDGNTFEKFDNDDFIKVANSLKVKDSNDLSGDEVFVSFGTPRLMENIKMSLISNETRENILTFSRPAEQACTASIILSTIKSFSLQNCKVEIWAYGKNRLFKTYRQLFKDNNVKIIEDIDAVCDAIYALKQSIIRKETNRKLIVLIGMERICMDFDFVVSGESVSDAPRIDEIRNGFIEKGAVVSSDEDEKKRQKALAWVKHKRILKTKATEKGLDKKQTEAFLEEEKEKYFKSYDELEKETDKATEEYNNNEEKIKEENANTVKKEHVPGAYNAMEDFAFVIKQGSRLGTHFMLNLNSVADVKQCKLKPDFFRYKLAFQLSVDDSRLIFNNKVATSLPEHICQFDDTLERYSFRPYLHKGTGWDGWYVDDNERVINPYTSD